MPFFCIKAMSRDFQKQPFTPVLFYLEWLLIILVLSLSLSFEI